MCETGQQLVRLMLATPGNFTAAMNLLLFVALRPRRTHHTSFQKNSASLLALCRENPASRYSVDEFFSFLIY
jgi:hypothetical protein